MNDLRSDLAWIGRGSSSGRFCMIDFLEQSQRGGHGFFLRQSRFTEAFEQVCEVGSGRGLGIMIFSIACLRTENSQIG